MNITTDLFAFPVRDPRWPAKAAIAALLGLVGFVLFPVLWLINGYGLRVMRQTLHGDSPSLPEWDQWGDLFMDGLRYFVVSFVYTLPITLVLWILYALAFVILSGSPVVEMIFGEELTAETAPLAIAMLIGVGSMIMGALGLLALPLQFLGMVGLTRAVAQGSLRSAFEVGEVWKLMRAGLSDFALAIILWAAVVFGLSMLISLLLYTIVLTCLFPLALGVTTAYSSVLLGALLGIAYRRAQQKLIPAAAVS